MALPYPGMDFVPLDILRADELDQMVANIEYLNGLFPVTSSNIDFTTIIEKVGTADNYALKYADGTMICCQRISCTMGTVGQWGTLYNATLSPKNVNYAVEFYTAPTISVDYESSSLNGMIINKLQDGTPTKAHSGSYDIIRPTTFSTTGTVIVNVIAIGRWKA